MGHVGQYINTLWVMWDSTAAHCGSYGIVQQGIVGHTGQYIHALWIIWDSIPVSSGSCGTVICALWVMWDSTAAHCGTYGMVASCCFESSQLLEVTSGLCGTVQLCVVGHVGQYNDTLWIM